MSYPSSVTARVTLSDVAREAGVSLATASRAINGSANRTVRPELRERVLAAAARLRYTPDATAQAMARGRTTSVGLVVHDVTDPSCAALVAGVVAVTDAADLQVTLACAQHEAAREIELVRLLQRQRARAVVVAGPRHDDDMADDLLRQALGDYVAAGGSAVVVGTASLGVDAVVVDDAGGADALAHALHALGYRQPAVLGGPRTHLASRTRREAFAHAFASLGCPVDPAHVVLGELTHEGGAAAMRELLRRREPVDVVLAVDDVLALGALAAARAQGVRVPQDVALTGFDDVLTLRDVVPPLTTVRVPHLDVGRCAALLALDERRGTDPRVLTVDTEVLLRASTPDRGGLAVA